LLADLIAEVAAGVPASTLIAPCSVPFVERVCNGEDVRTDVAAWTEVMRGAPVVAELVLRLAELGSVRRSSSAARSVLHA